MPFDDTPYLGVAPPVFSQPDPPSGTGWSGMAQVLQNVSKGMTPAANTTPSLAALKPVDVPVGRPRQAQSLDALVKLLQQQQTQYTGLSGQPVAMPRTAGLLGF